jgi:uncharacterized protein (DUF2132 family)
LKLQFLKIQKRKPQSEEPQKAEQPTTQKQDPMHGIKLKDILEYLVAEYGWREMGRRIDIRCFKFDPSIKSSLHFLRRTAWAREKVEEWYKSDKV